MIFNLLEIDVNQILGETLDTKIDNETDNLTFFSTTGPDLKSVEGAELPVFLLLLAGRCLADCGEGDCGDCCCIIMLYSQTEL